MSETSYRLYVLDGDGHIIRAKNLRCSNVLEALKIVHRHPRDLGLELWEGPRRLHTFPAMGKANASSYLLYLIMRDEVVGATAMDAITDLQACQMASHIFHACDDQCDSFELWHGNTWLQSEIDGRTVTTGLTEAFANPFLGRFTRLERCLQDRVIEDEQQLRDSYSAIQASRKLLDTLKVLRPAL